VYNTMTATNPAIKAREIALCDVDSDTEGQSEAVTDASRVSR